MRGTKFHIVPRSIALLFAITSLCLHAQETETIDVPAHLFPSIYRSPGVDQMKSDTAHWTDNISMQFDWAPQVVFNSRTSQVPLNAFAFGLLKDYTPAHAGLLRVAYDTYQHRVGVNLGYLWNLTNYYWGYDRGRRSSWAFTTGLEGGRSDLGGYAGLYVGTRFDYAITPHSSLFLEPRWGVYGGNYTTLLQTENVEDDPLVSSLSAQLGYRFRLTEQLNRLQEKKSIERPQEHRWWVDFAVAMHEKHLFSDATRYETTTDGNGNVQNNVYKEKVDSLLFGAGVSMSLGFRGNKYSSVRTRIDLTGIDGDTHLTTSVDYLYCLSNGLLGENTRRLTDMEVLIGPVVMVEGLSKKSETRTSFGLEWGARIGRRLNSQWDLYIEPRWSFVKCYAKEMDGCYSFNFQPSLGLGYTYARDRYYRSLRRMPMRGWYVQSLVGVQMATFDSEGGTHQLGNMEFNIGRDLSTYWGGRLGIFSGSMKSKEMDPMTAAYNDVEYPMFFSYFGIRLEALMHLLPMISPSMLKSRWDWAVSGGFEYGQVSNRHRNTAGFTAASQLQYRVGTQTWLTLAGRYHSLTKVEAVAPMEVQLGVQYDFSMPRVFDFDEQPFRWYVQGGGAYHDAFLNSDNFGYHVAVGADFNRVHGVRLNMISTPDCTRLGADYVYHLTERRLGIDPDRRADFSLLVGAEVDKDSMKEDGKEAWGLAAGVQMDYHLNRHLDLFVQPRFSYTPWKESDQPILDPHMGLYTLFGIKLNL